MKKLLTLAGLLVSCSLFAQKPVTPPAQNPPPAANTPGAAKANEPKKYADVITDKAVTKHGLFTVHKVDEKWYFEIPDSVFNQEIMAVTRFSKVAGGGGVYGGELANQQTILFQKGPTNNVFLRVMTVISVADSTNEIYKAVNNSYVNPIAAAFDVKALGKDSQSVVIDVTDFFKGDNQVVSINPFTKKRLNLNGLSPDRSYIQSIHTYPLTLKLKQ